MSKPPRPQEVTEEALGPVVAFVERDAPKLGGLVRDDYFVLRVDSHEVDSSGMEERELVRHSGHRWWSGAASGLAECSMSRIAALSASSRNPRRHN